MINNSNSSLHLPLELSEILKEKNIVVEFYYHIPTQHLKLTLNHRYQQINAIFKIDVDDWSKNAEKIRKILKPKDVNKDDIELIISTLDNHWKKILNVFNNYQAAIVVSDLYDLSAQTKNNNDSDNFKNQSGQQQEQESKQQNNIPLLTVLEAKRSSEGIKRVIGRIVGRSTNFRVISKSEWKCQNYGKCANRGSSIYNPPKLASTSKFRQYYWN